MVVQTRNRDSQVNFSIEKKEEEKYLVHFLGTTCFQLYPEETTKCRCCLVIHECSTNTQEETFTTQWHSNSDRQTLLYKLNVK